LTTASAVGLQRTSLLGAYFDGHVYIEIARSFPLPYAPEARGYLGHAPGFSALLWAARLLTFGAIDWGTLSTALTWLTAAAAAVVFHGVCRETDVPPAAATACFAAANPAWLLCAASPHPEPLAMTFALLCLRAHLRGALGASMLWLALAALTRFPAILVGAALAFDLVVVQRRLGPRTLAWLALPPIALALHQLYLFARIPGFEGIWAAHDTHWQTRLTWPFAELVRYGVRTETFASIHHRIVYAFVPVYLGAIAFGFRRAERRLWVLPAWMAAVVVFHASLSGEEGVGDFMRLALLAWPALVIECWRGLGSARARAFALAATALAGALGLWHVSHQIPEAVAIQDRLPWMQWVVPRLDADAPVWIDFDLGRPSTPAR
jgi:hypothetical protein